MNSPTPEIVLAGLISYFIFLISTVVHEASHAITAHWFGDDTAADEGLVTLDPLPHIRREPMGMVGMPLIGLILNGFVIGWGSAPYNLSWARAHPRYSALMALAGPASNFCIALLAYGAMWAGIMAGIFEIPDQMSVRSLIISSHDGLSGVTMALSLTVSLNLFLGLFNLLPIPPLDGSSVISLFVPRRYAQMITEARTNPTFQMIGLFLVFTCGSKLIFPLFTTILWTLF